MSQTTPLFNHADCLVIAKPIVLMEHHMRGIGDDEFTDCTIHNFHNYYRWGNYSEMGEEIVWTRTWCFPAL